MKKSIVFRDQLVKISTLSPAHSEQSSSPIMEHALFIHSSNESEFLGDVDGCDVIIIDEVVETANSLSTLCHKLKKGGAKKKASDNDGEPTPADMCGILKAQVESLHETFTTPLLTQVGHAGSSRPRPSARIRAATEPG